VFVILFADDELNPIELGAHTRALARVPKRQHLVLPASGATEGHRSQVKSELWAAQLAAFLARVPTSY
jgi:hypothetical protein